MNNSLKMKNLLFINEYKVYLEINIRKFRIGKPTVKLEKVTLEPIRL